MFPGDVWMESCKGATSSGEVCLTVFNTQDLLTGSECVMWFPLSFTAANCVYSVPYLPRQPSIMLSDPELIRALPSGHTLPAKESS